MGSKLPSTFVPGFHNPDAVSKMRYTRLGATDMWVSCLGHGGAAFGDVFGKLSFEESRSILLRGLESGINFVDTAPQYGEGRSEKVIGLALEGVPRRAYYLATKVGCYGGPTTEVGKRFDFTRERTRRSVEDSLKALGVEYIDLVQIHGAEFSSSLEQIVMHTLPTLFELQAEGKLRYIGVNSYHLDVLRRVVELSPANSIDTVLTFCRYTLFNKDFVYHANFFKDRGIGVINASPVGMGLMAETIPHWHPAPKRTKETAKKAAEFAKEKGFTLASLALKMCLHSPLFPVCLGSPASSQQMDSSLRAAANPPTVEEVEAAEEIDERFFRYMTCPHWENLKVEAYWKEMEEKGAEQPTDL